MNFKYSDARVVWPAVMGDREGWRRGCARCEQGAVTQQGFIHQEAKVHGLFQLLGRSVGLRSVWVRWQRSGRGYIPSSFTLDGSMKGDWLCYYLFALSGMVTSVLGRRHLPAKALDSTGKLLQSNLNYWDGGVGVCGVFLEVWVSMLQFPQA